jgi:hypothetical protein
MTADDLSGQIAAFLKAATVAADQLANSSGVPLEYVHIEEALLKTLELDESIDLLSKHLGADEIVSLLADFDFRCLFPETIEDVRLDSSIIPSKTARQLIEVTVRANGEVWRIHKNDQDPWPSNPHAHNLQSGLKLHLGTGELFRKKRSVGKISRKDLELIRTKITKCQLPPLQA